MLSCFATSWSIIAIDPSAIQPNTDYKASEQMCSLQRSLAGLLIINHDIPCLITLLCVTLFNAENQH